ncbi:MAG: BON domain-containing protein [Myxococcales bacterium]
MDKYIATLVATAFAAACASHENPPAASAESVQEASSTPSAGPGFAPASNDGTASAAADTHAGTDMHATDSSGRATKPLPVVGGTAPAAVDTATPPPTDNAAAMPARDTTAGKPDNSRVNERDKGGKTLTPMDQGPSESDRKITQLIRQSVVKDSSLSFTAKNVKIITIGGKVTLRGPVKTDAERSAIEAQAKNVAGVSQVDNQLEVKN